MSKEDSKIIYVSMGNMQAAANDAVLRSNGIGSCIVITLYDPIKRIGALAHPMLAGQEIKKTIPRQSSGQGNQEINLRYVEHAIDAMIDALEKLGGFKNRFEAKIIGGANMFEVFDSNPESIGVQNIETARRKLAKEGIEIIATDTGENCGRSVSFDLRTGLVEVKTKI